MRHQMGICKSRKIWNTEYIIIFSELQISTIFVLSYDAHFLTPSLFERLVRGGELSVCWIYRVAPKK